MSKRPCFFVVASAIACLTACGDGSNPFSLNGSPSLNGSSPSGGGGSGGAPTPSSDEAGLLASGFDDLSSAVAALDRTPANLVPTDGTATFTGLSRVIVTPRSGGAAIALYGDAEIEADFAGPSLNAQFSNFSADDGQGSIVALGGNLSVANAPIAAAGGSSDDVAGTFSGSLQGNGISVVADGVFNGQFFDTPTSAISVSGTDNNGSLNAAPATITLSGAAQQ